MLFSDLSESRSPKAQVHRLVARAHPAWAAARWEAKGDGSMCFLISLIPLPSVPKLTKVKNKSNCAAQML